MEFIKKLRSYNPTSGYAKVMQAAADEIERLQSAVQVKPIPTRERLPNSQVMDEGTEEVWWWNMHESAWFIGGPMLMDFEDDDTFDKYTHWLPKEAIVEPEGSFES